MDRCLIVFMILALHSSYVFTCFPEFITDWQYVQEVCGTRPLFQSGPEVRVFNGRDAPLGAWPWIGQITGTECILVLFSDQWALTIVQCLADIRGSSVTFGEVERYGDSSDYRQEVDIQNVYLNPEYIPRVQDPLQLVRLANPVNITDYVRPICLNEYSNEWEVYTNCWIAGYGLVNNHDDLPNTLQEARAGVMSQEDCIKFGKPIHDSEICGISGGNAEPRSCRRDAGTPMMCSEDGGERWNLVGLFVGGLGECENNTSIYSRISNQTDFIGATLLRYEGCSEPDMRCSNWTTNPICVLEDDICDGVEHCPLGEDEMNCTASSPAPCTEDACANGGTCMETMEGANCLCDDLWTGETCEQVACGGNISISLGETVEIMSPYYPSPYPNRTTCKWAVTAPQGYRIRVQFADFNLEDGFDFLHIDEAQFSVGSPKSFVSEDETVDMEFTSDFGTSESGFLLDLSPIPISGVNECDWEPCNNNGSCVDEADGFSCNCSGIWGGRLCTAFTDNAFCGEPDIVLKPDEPRNLSSFGYPGYNKYQGMFSCKWIVTAPPGMHVRVEILDVQVWIPRDVLTLDKKAIAAVPTEDYISEGSVLEIIYFTIGFHPSASTPALGFNAVLHTYLPPDGDECSSGPCQNGGRCNDRVNGFTCKCKRGFMGKTCQTGSSRCGRNTFQCNNGRCIRASYVCDGRNHCGDTSDEINCECEFNCYNGRCLPRRFVCDKNNNCGDGTDEYRPEC